MRVLWFPVLLCQYLSVLMVIIIIDEPLKVDDEQGNHGANVAASQVFALSHV